MMPYVFIWVVGFLFSLGIIVFEEEYKTKPLQIRAGIMALLVLGWPVALGLITRRVVVIFLAAIIGDQGHPQQQPQRPHGH